MRVAFFLTGVILLIQCATQSTYENDSYTQEVMKKGGPDAYFDSLSKEYGKQTEANKNIEVKKNENEGNKFYNNPYSSENIEKFAKQQKCPLLIIEYEVVFNSINHPVARISFFNNSDKNIDALEVDMNCYNTWGDPVKYYSSGGNQFRGWAQNQQILSKDVIQLEWNLTGYEQTAKINNVRIYRLHFIDGTTWKRK